MVDCQVPTPFLPKISQKHKKTLVLDLDETLIHFNEDQQRLHVQDLIQKFIDEYGHSPTIEDLQTMQMPLLFAIRPYAV